jgi:hypothetical protein
MKARRKTSSSAGPSSGFRSTNPFAVVIVVTVSRASSWSVVQAWNCAGVIAAGRRSPLDRLDAADA